MHDTVLDFGNDPQLHDAAEATGRTYAAISDTADVDTATRLPGPAGLILMRWPHPTVDETAPDTTILLRRCRQHLTAGGSTIVMTARRPGPGGNSSADHEQILLPAAEVAGFKHVHDIVVMDTGSGRDTFMYATDREAAAPADTGGGRPDAVTVLVVLSHPQQRP